MQLSLEYDFTSEFVVKEKINLDIKKGNKRTPTQPKNRSCKLL